MTMYRWKLYHNSKLVLVTEPVTEFKKAQACARHLAEKFRLSDGYKLVKVITDPSL